MRYEILNQLKADLSWAKKKLASDDDVTLHLETSIAEYQEGQLENVIDRLALCIAMLMKKT